MQIYFTNLLSLQHIPSSKMKINISLNFALLIDKNKPLSHTAHNTERTMYLSNKTECYLFTVMHMLYSLIGE